MFSQAMFVGFVATDPEIKKTKTERSLCKFNLAVDRPVKSAGAKSTADFHRIEVWDGYAEFIATTVKKGDKIFVSSRPVNRTYPDKNGANRTITFYTASHIEFAGTKKDKFLPPPPLDLSDLFSCAEEDGEVLQ